MRIQPKGQNLFNIVPNSQPYYGGKEVFKISHNESNQRNPQIDDLDNPPSLDKFDKLSPSMKYTKFQAQAYEIKQLKRKIRKSARTPIKDVMKSFSDAERIVKRAKVELEDQQNIMENLLVALNEGKLIPKSFAFDRICTIVRSALDDKNYDMTSKEKLEYGYMTKLEKTMNVLRGKEIEKECTEKEKAEEYLLIHGEFLKNLSYSDFLKILKENKDN